MIVIPCADLDEALSFFTGRLGFAVDAIMPADAPMVAELSGPGGRVRLERSGDVASVTGWRIGRAGMRYRDLLPAAADADLVASRIHIPQGGPVGDWVHWHEVAFQMIFCWRGRVSVAYEDQGPPIELRAGDCVLQPPQIRHRVLECDPDLEVVEITSPAVHWTRADRELSLPNAALAPARTWSGQRFCLARAAGAVFGPAAQPGFRARDLGIFDATAGRADVQVVRPSDAGGTAPLRLPAARGIHVVLAGSVDLRVAGGLPEHLVAGEARLVAAGAATTLADASPDLELLSVRIA